MVVWVVMVPNSPSYHPSGYWMFGEMWCNIHSAMDVLTCTASIMNICLISLDRYWSITKAVDYLTQRTPLRVMLMIFTVWVLSGLISIPPLLGWKVPKVRQPASPDHVAKCHQSVSSSSNMSLVG